MNSHTDASYSSSKRIILGAWLAIIAFAMLGAVWWHYGVMAKRVDIVEADSETEMDLGKLSSIPLYDVALQKTVKLKSSEDGPKRLLIFLTAADCALCLDELGDWVSLVKPTSSKHVQVDLIYLNTASNELASFMSSNPLPYNIYLDQRGELTRRIKIPPQTPVTILVDRHFKILAAQAPERDKNVRQPFVSKVKALVSSQD